MIKWDYCYIEEHYSSDGEGTYMTRRPDHNTISFRYVTPLLPGGGYAHLEDGGYRFETTAQIIGMLGADGWEMCGVVDVGYDTGSQRKLRHYFKRQLPEE